MIGQSFLFLPPIHLSIYTCQQIYFLFHQQRRHSTFKMYSEKLQHSTGEMKDIIRLMPHSFDSTLPARHILASPHWDFNSYPSCLVAKIYCYSSSKQKDTHFLYPIRVICSSRRLLLFLIDFTQLPVSVPIRGMRRWVCLMEQSLISHNFFAKHLISHTSLKILDVPKILHFHESINTLRNFKIDINRDKPS